MRRPALALAAACAALAAAPPPAGALDGASVGRSLAAQMRFAGAFAGAYAQDLDTGRVLFARRADVARPPASVQKLYTTGSALRRHGAQDRIVTQVFGTGAQDFAGAWVGDLYLHGAGDPTLRARGLASLANALAARGIATVEGRVLADESLFDVLRGGPRTGFRLDGAIGGILGALTVDRRGVGADAARRFARALRAAGIDVVGGTGVGVTPPGGSQLAALASPTIAEIARATNVASDNFYAEQLLKELGARFGAGGTTPSGAAVVRATVAELGVTPSVADGSGLSRANRTSPRQVVRFLDAMRDDAAVGPAFEASLAVAGRTGTVRRRMRGTAAAGRCRTKTGTLRSLSALAGVCTTTAARTVGFAFLMDRVNVFGAHRLQDRMAAALATYDGL